MTKKASAEATVRNIRRKTRRRYSAEEKIRIVLDGKNTAVVTVTYRFDHKTGVHRGRGSLVIDETLGRSLNYSGSLEIVRM